MDSILKLYAVLLPLVLLAGLAEGVWQSRTRAAGYDWKEWATSLGDVLVRRLLAFVPYGVAGPIFFWAYDHRLFAPKIDTVAGVLLLFISLEFFYYWFHRASHTVRWFWNTHSVHHSPNRFTLAAAYRLGWLGKFIGATLFFTPMMFMGFEPVTVLVALQLNLLYQFWIHADWIPRLGWLEGVLNTPSAHRVHHARNPEYLDANFGGVLVIFDRLFGTYVAEREDRPCQYLQAGADQLRAVDRHGEGPGRRQVPARGLALPVRRAGLAPRWQGPDDQGTAGSGGHDLNAGAWFPRPR
jgi:sterol desaturase/sphingolipid hydroxylase (fatty acid hydroxylase superfamily)